MQVFSRTIWSWQRFDDILESPFGRIGKSNFFNALLARFWLHAVDVSWGIISIGPLHSGNILDCCPFLGWSSTLMTGLIHLAGIGWVDI